MSVKAREEVRKLPENEDRPVLILELDNGDKGRFQEQMLRWRFADEQSMMRFMVSILMASDDGKTAGYISNGQLISVEPLDEHLVK